MLDIELDRRIAVVGCTGAGKSTLAARLAVLIGASHTQLDNLYHGPNWTPRPDEDFRKDLMQTVSQEAWFIDGNYTAVRDQIWPRATTLIWLDYSLTTCLLRLVPRTVRRAARREIICNGNRETWRQSFASSDSILLWAIRTHKKIRERTAAYLAKPEHAHLRVIHCRRPRDADAITLR
ncbi:topology modulation protein [Planctomycetes bacterium MalM25]|nr:topology modulation protein [Planctomycetes bacterium MalM25]